MSMRHTTITEHAGAKNGGSGFYGRRAEAKAVCDKLRRANDAKAIADGLRLLNDNRTAVINRESERKTK